MESIITDDGSVTYRHPKHLEPYHTKAGAIVEALEKHARALKVWERQNPIIFDVCSGVSYNAVCALEEIRSHDNNSFVEIYLFENDRAILKKHFDMQDSLVYEINGKKKKIESYKYFKEAMENYLHNNVTIYTAPNLRITIIFGDFMSMIKTVNDFADFVFYAPFSPKITPNMWTLDVFKKLFSHMNHGAKLSTYSYARSVRDSITQAGFTVENGPTIGRRSPSLIVLKK